MSEFTLIEYVATPEDGPTKARHHIDLPNQGKYANLYATLTQSYRGWVSVTLAIYDAGKQLVTYELKDNHERKTIATDPEALTRLVDDLVHYYTDQAGQRIELMQLLWGPEDGDDRPDTEQQPEDDRQLIAQLRRQRDELVDKIDRQQAKLDDVRHQLNLMRKSYQEELGKRAEAEGSLELAKRKLLMEQTAVGNIGVVLRDEALSDTEKLNAIRVILE